MPRGTSSKLSLEANLKLTSEDKARKEITYTVDVKHPKDDILFAVSRPIQLTKSSRLNVSWRKLNETYPIGDQPDVSAGVPLELRELLGLLVNARGEIQKNPVLDPTLDTYGQLLGTTFGPQIAQGVDNLKSRGLNMTFSSFSDSDYHLFVAVSGEVPVYDDITSVHSVASVPVNDSYTVTSLVSEATDVDLRDAGTQYEDWVTARYLSLPATVPARVRALARQIIAQAGATNPYDEAKAIESYLRLNYKYTVTIAQPPSGMDRVDWFLFQSKEGYCEYYAGAMVVMLRSLGVPTRMASGYAPGTYDEATESFVVKESSAHTWPEVYFPGYGWVEFEPTPSQAVVSHDGLTIPPTVEPTPQASPGISPSPVDNSKRQNVDDQTSRGGFGGFISPTWNAPVALSVIALLVGFTLIFFTFFVPIMPWARRNSKCPMRLMSICTTRLPSAPSCRTTAP